MALYIIEDRNYRYNRDIDHAIRINLSLAIGLVLKYSTLNTFIQLFKLN